MAWEGSDRRERLPDNWASEIVPAVKRRDGGRCTWTLPSGARCPRPGTDVDHRKPGDDHSLWNLQLLCSTHHLRKTAVEAYKAKSARRNAGKRREEKHPGVR